MKLVFKNDKTAIQNEYSQSCYVDDNGLTKTIFSIFENEQKTDYSFAKAKAIVYILENAEIRVSENNIFAHDIIHAKVMHKVCDKAKRNLKSSVVTEKTKELESIKAFRATMDFGHVAPDWKYILDNGIINITKQLYEYRSIHKNNKKKIDYYDRRIEVYEAMRNLFLRFAEKASSVGNYKTELVSKNLYHLADNPPCTMHQALQLILLFYTIQTHLDAVVIRSLGGLDRLLYPYYLNDISSGEYTKEDLKEILKYFIFTVSCMKVTANMPFYICGLNEFGQDNTNELTEVILDVYRELDIYDPKMHVMYHDKIDKTVLLKVLEMIREGKNSFVFINTQIASSALIRLGIEEDDAKKVIPYGCYEPAAEGTEVSCTCGGMINLAKSIELILASDTQYENFDSFYTAVISCLLDYTIQCMDTIASYEPHYSDVCPSMIMSATYKHSRESGIDIYSGGAKYNNTSIVGAAMATLVDSLLAVKYVVYDEKIKTLCEFRDILQTNWEKDPMLRRQILNLKNKFGNSKIEADNLTKDIYCRFANVINGRKNGRGGVFRCGVFSVDWRFGMGKSTKATPDGRYDAEPLSKNLEPSVGQDKEGVTSYLNSLLKLDSTICPDGYVADVHLHYSALEGSEGMTAFEGLLRSFMNRGGFAVHFNILDPNTLLKAQKEPQNYRNLQIRLCGWNVLFVDLDKQQQDELITRTQNFN